MSARVEPGNAMTPEPVAVRPAMQSDAGSIAQIYNHHVDLGGSTFDTTHWTEQYIRSLLKSSAPEIWLVADQLGSVVGWASARWYSMRHGYRFTMESAIYLDPASMGTGISHALQTELEQRCRENQIHHLVAKIAAENQRSLAFHYRHGYELVGVQKEIGHMDGGWKDVAILQKLFAQPT